MLSAQTDCKHFRLELYEINSRLLAVQLHRKVIKTKLKNKTSSFFFSSLFMRPIDFLIFLLSAARGVETTSATFWPLQSASPHPARDVNSEKRTTFWHHLQLLRLLPSGCCAVCFSHPSSANPLQTASGMFVYIVKLCVSVVVFFPSSLQNG